MNKDIAKKIISDLEEYCIGLGGEPDGDDYLQTLIQSALDAKDDEIASFKRQFEGMVEALEDAIDCVQAWSSYASDYFKDKHDLEGDLTRLNAALAYYKQSKEK